MEAKTLISLLVVAAIIIITGLPQSTSPGQLKAPGEDWSPWL